MVLMARILLLLFVLLPAALQGVTVGDLFEAEVPVNDMQTESRAPAIRTALGIVLTKLTGDRYAQGNPVLSQLLQRAESYVTEFRDNADSLSLWVRFDEVTLEKDIRALGIPVWGKERPLTIIWFVADTDAGREILSRDGNQSYVDILDKGARRRGIVISYPLLDLEDSANLRPSDIWAGFMQPVINASRRYPVDAVLAGTIESNVPGIWEGKWYAYIEGENVYSWRTEGDLPDIVLDEGIDGMADFLASNSTVRK